MAMVLICHLLRFLEYIFACLELFLKSDKCFLNFISVSIDYDDPLIATVANDRV